MAAESEPHRVSGRTTDRRDRAEALLLDEMLSPALTAALRDEGFDVVAAAGHPILGALRSWLTERGERADVEWLT